MATGLNSCGQVKAKVTFSPDFAGQGQGFLVAAAVSSCDAGQVALQAYSKVAEVLGKQRLEILHERIFGSLSAEASVVAARRDALQACGVPWNNPITYVQGSPPWGEGYAGSVVHAVSLGISNDVWTIMDGQSPCGRGWKLDGATYLALHNVNGLNSSSAGNESKPQQVRWMLDCVQRILRENGGSYRDVVRTWFYLSDILDWYAAFNKVRNEKYREFGIMPGPGDCGLLLPASTGIQGDVPSGAAATMDLLAVVADRGSRPLVRQLSNSEQLDAFRYGSAFSRGALIEGPAVCLLQISGTAAVDRQGKSQFINDIRGQINCTFEKIEKLMGKEGAGLKDIAAANVFVKRPEHVEIFWNMARDRGLEEFPAVCVVADICREELLFEVDAEAAFAPSRRKTA